MLGATPVTAPIKTHFTARTLVVGEEEDIVASFPNEADELLRCDNLEICGKLSAAVPTDDLWKRIEASKAERLWIIGGDGTINLVGECLLQHRKSMPCYLTPAGTANDLSRAIAERLAAASTDESAVTNNELSTVMLDLLEVTLDESRRVRCCANMLTLGSSARNTQHVTDDIKARWGALAYLTQIWKAIGDLQPFAIKLTVGQSEPRSVEGVLNLFLANSPYCGGGYRVVPPAVVDDGVMDAVIFRQGTTAGLAHVVATFLAGGHLDHELVEHFSFETLTIECPDESPLTLDGEAFTARHIAVRVLPNYLPITLLPKQ